MVGAYLIIVYFFSNMHSIMYDCCQLKNTPNAQIVALTLVVVVTNPATHDTGTQQRGCHQLRVLLFPPSFPAKISMFSQPST
jgi:hypothetical protein